MSQDFDLKVFKYNVVSFNNKKFKWKRKRLEMEQKVNGLLTQLYDNKNKMYTPIGYNYQYYENEPYDAYKRKFAKETKRIIPDYFVLNKKVGLSSEDQEKEHHLDMKKIDSVTWLEDECKIKFHNDEYEYIIESEVTLFIQDYVSFMISQNLTISNWHHKLIQRSLDQTYFINSEQNSTYYYLNYKISTFHHSNIHCKNAYYYKSFSDDIFSSRFKRISECKPISLQMQAAYCIFKNFDSIDKTYINTKGVRNVAKKIYFKVNCWANITLEEILLHKLYVSQCKFKFNDNLMAVAYPYCQCKFTLTNGECMLQGECLLCMSLQHNKVKIRFQHSLYPPIRMIDYSKKYDEYIYCFCK